MRIFKHISFDFPTQIYIYNYNIKRNWVILSRMGVLTRSPKDECVVSRNSIYLAVLLSLCVLNSKSFLPERNNIRVGGWIKDALEE